METNKYQDIKKEELPSLFNKDDFDVAKNEWVGMPEFVQKDLTACKTIMVNFLTVEDMVAFAKLMGQPISKNTKSIWFPKVDYDKLLNKSYIDEP